MRGGSKKYQKWAILDILKQHCRQTDGRHYDANSRLTNNQFQLRRQHSVRSDSFAAIHCGHLRLFRIKIDNNKLITSKCRMTLVNFVHAIEPISFVSFMSKNSELL